MILFKPLALWIVDHSQHQRYARNSYMYYWDFLGFTIRYEFNCASQARIVISQKKLNFVKSFYGKRV
jgi:hypothetical protein